MTSEEEKSEQRFVNIFRVFFEIIARSLAEGNLFQLDIHVFDLFLIVMVKNVQKN